jgi:predicted ester cyclase
MSIERIMERERWATEVTFIRGNVDALDKVFASDAVFTIYPSPPIAGLAVFKQNVAAVAQALSDIKWSWDEVIIAGNTAVQRYTLCARHTGSTSVIPVLPTGKEVTLNGCAVYHLKNDKIVEFIEYPNMLGLMQQLGAIPSQ